MCLLREGKTNAQGRQILDTKTKPLMATECNGKTQTHIYTHTHIYTLVKSADNKNEYENSTKCETNKFAASGKRRNERACIG